MSPIDTTTKNKGVTGCSESRQPNGLFGSSQMTVPFQCRKFSIVLHQQEAILNSSQGRVDGESSLLSLSRYAITITITVTSAAAHPFSFPNPALPALSPHANHPIYHLLHHRRGRIAGRPDRDLASRLAT